MTESGILAFGAYVPMLRLDRRVVYAANSWFAPGLMALAKGERAVANWDEDPVTMAVEAARDCLSGHQTVPAGLIFASTSAPWADRLNAGIVKEAMDLPDTSFAMDASGGLRAGTSALIQALGQPHAQLVAAAEQRRARPASEGELLFGDAAAALLVGTAQADALVARFLGSHSVTLDFVDHFRAADAPFDYGWEARWVRDEGFGRLAADALVQGLAALKVEAAGIDHFLGPTPRGVGALLARKAGIRPDAVRDTLADCVGDAGAAHPLLLLAHVLETAAAGEVIALLGFGQGVDLLLFEATGNGPRPRTGVSGALARRRAVTSYLKYLAFAGHLELEKGMRAEADMKQPLTALWRNRRAVMALVGGRCRKTGTIQFPKSDIGVNPNDHAPGTQEDIRLADVPARIVSFTADSLTYCPDPPQHYGLIDFEGGGRMMAEFTDVAPGEVHTGQRVRMVFRVKNRDEQRGFSRYFWKAVPAGQGDS